MSTKESVNKYLVRISDLKQQIREFHNEMNSNPDMAINYIKIIGDIEIEIVKYINKINNR